MKNSSFPKLLGIALLCLVALVMNSCTTSSNDDAVRIHDTIPVPPVVDISAIGPLYTEGRAYTCPYTHCEERPISWMDCKKDQMVDGYAFDESFKYDYIVRQGPKFDLEGWLHQHGINTTKWSAKKPDMDTKTGAKDIGFPTSKPMSQQPTSYQKSDPWSGLPWNIIKWILFLCVCALALVGLIWCLRLLWEALTRPRVVQTPAPTDTGNYASRSENRTGVSEVTSALPNNDTYMLSVPKGSRVSILADGPNGGVRIGDRG